MAKRIVDTILVFLEHWLPMISVTNLSLHLTDIVGAFTASPELMLFIYGIAGISHFTNYVSMTVSLWYKADEPLWKKLLFTFGPLIVAGILTGLVIAIGLATLTSAVTVAIPYVILIASIYNVLMNAYQVLNLFYEQAVQGYYQKMVSRFFPETSEDSWFKAIAYKLLAPFLLISAIIMAWINDPLFLFTMLRNDKDHKLITQATLTTLFSITLAGTILFYFVPGLNLVATALLITGTMGYIAYTLVKNRHYTLSLLMTGINVMKRLSLNIGLNLIDIAIYTTKKASLLVNNLIPKNKKAISAEELEARQQAAQSGNHDSLLEFATNELPNQVGSRFSFWRNSLRETAEVVEDQIESVTTQIDTVTGIEETLQSLPSLEADLGSIAHQVSQVPAFFANHFKT